MEAAPTCFGLQRNRHQGATASAWLKLQDWFSVDIDVVQTLSVLWRHSVTCAVHCASIYICTVHSTHATQVILCRHSTDNVSTMSISTL